MPEEPRRKRRSIESGAMTTILRAKVDDETCAKIRALSERYDVAVGTIVRECIQTGLRAVTERLRRASRTASREAARERGRASDTAPANGD